MLQHKDGRIHKERKKKGECTLNRAQTSVLPAPVPSRVNTGSSVGRSSQLKTNETYQVDQRQR